MVIATTTPPHPVAVKQPRARESRMELVINKQKIRRMHGEWGKQINQHYLLSLLQLQLLYVVVVVSRFVEHIPSTKYTATREPSRTWPYLSSTLWPLPYIFLQGQSLHSPPSICVNMYVGRFDHQCEGIKTLH